jgi:hypothetical protein
MGHFLRLEVAHVDDPDAVESRPVGEVQLFPQLGDGGRVHHRSFQGPPFMSMW